MPITSRGHEVGTAFSQNCKEISVYAYRVFHFSAVPEEGTEQASPQESRMHFSEDVLYPSKSPT